MHGNGTGGIKELLKLTYDLLPFYAILRSIPNKLLGVIAMFSAILILLVMPFTDLSKYRGIQFKPLSKIAFFNFVGNFLILMILGAKHVESPFIEFGQISTVIYFAYFLIIVPLFSLFENTLIEYNSIKQKADYAPTPTSTENVKKYNKRIITMALWVFGNIFVEYFYPQTIMMDAPRPWGIYFQDSATPQMEGLVELHDNIVFYLFIIFFGVSWTLAGIIIKFNSRNSPVSQKFVSHGTLIELIWTITPALILMFIALPSFKLLYLMDEVSDPSMAILAEGFFFLGGLKLYILNKIKEAISLRSGEKNNTLVSNKLAQFIDAPFKFKLINLTSFNQTQKRNYSTSNNNSSVETKVKKSILLLNIKKYTANLEDSKKMFDQVNNTLEKAEKVLTKVNIFSKAELEELRATFAKEKKLEQDKVNDFASDLAKEIKQYSNNNNE